MIEFALCGAALVASCVSSTTSWFDSRAPLLSLSSTWILRMPTPTLAVTSSSSEPNSFTSESGSMLTKTGRPNPLLEDKRVPPDPCGDDQAGKSSSSTPVLVSPSESNVVAPGIHRIVVISAAYKFPASDEVYIEAISCRVSDMAYLSEVAKVFKEQLMDSNLEVLKMVVTIVPPDLYG